MKVIPLFPPQLPLHPVIADKSHDAAHAPVISLKSALLNEFDADVIVRAVPRTEELTSTLLVTVAHISIVNTFVMVISPVRGMDTVLVGEDGIFFRL